MVLDISVTNSYHNNDTAERTIVTDICACCVEQGIVPQLEYIQQGIVIYSHLQPQSASTEHCVCFPEASIRSVCTTLLHYIVQEVQTHPTLLSRLTSAMLHSGNTKLRVNIFSGFMYLTGRCPAIGRYGLVELYQIGSYIYYILPVYSHCYLQAIVCISKRPLD